MLARQRLTLLLLAVLAVLVVAAALAGCAPVMPPPAPAPTVAPSTTRAGAGITPSPAPMICVSRSGLPDPACTPGATNPDVTQTTIRFTICRAGWTATIRPPLTYTEPIKRAELSTHGPVTLHLAGATVTVLPYGPYAGPWLSNYELDHLIPLELGGAPADVANLWLEADAGAKDAVEGRLKRAVCGGHVKLAAAQTAIARNWETAVAVTGA